MSDTFNNAITVTTKWNVFGRVVIFSRLPENLEEIKTLDITNEYIAASAVIAALAAYEKDPEESYKMLDYMMGPEDINPYTKSFIADQLKAYPYTIRSYFKGTSPEENYVLPEGPAKLIWSENRYSRQEEGYIKLWIESSGADSERQLTLRLKPSTGQWFLFSDTYKPLLSGIKMPKALDKWA